MIFSHQCQGFVTESNHQLEKGEEYGGGEEEGEGVGGGEWMGQNNGVRYALLHSFCSH